MRVELKEPWTKFTSLACDVVMFIAVSSLMCADMVEPVTVSSSIGNTPVS